MYENIDGISILVGTGDCNANCSHCAGIQHRHNAPREDGIVNLEQINRALVHVYEEGCRYVTLTGSGDPILSPESVTIVMALLYGFENIGRKFSPINIYTNGIKLGLDYSFADEYLPLWKKMGLSRVYVSVYSHDHELNKKGFGNIKVMPPFAFIARNILKHELQLRINIILKKKFVNNVNELMKACIYFANYGVTNISIWPVKDNNDYISKEAPNMKVLEEMHEWVQKIKKINNTTLRMLLSDTNNKCGLGKKIALFQDGTISDVWCARR